jgi:hypothetical protein
MLFHTVEIRLGLVRAPELIIATKFMQLRSGWGLVRAPELIVATKSPLDMSYLHQHKKSSCKIKI